MGNLTVNEHHEFGKELYAMRSKLMSRMIELSHLYGVNNKAVKRIESILKKFDEFRSLMDDYICKENPTLDNSQVLRAYYPNSGK